MDMPGCHCAVPIVKPKIESHKNGKCSVKPYRYQPLSSPTSIRLLKVQPFTGATHVCELDLFSPLKGSLVTVDLAENPSYTALSYTWGYPMVYYSSETDIVPQGDWYCQCYTIEIDGEEVTISTNLYTALVSLRYIKSAARYASSDGLQEDTEHIWIDALCINQSNLIEKSSQVQMMGRIYLQSKHVLVWLGGADHMSITAMALLNGLTEIGFSTHNEEGQYVGLELLPEMELDDPRFYKTLGMEWHISPREWSHIFAFLNRSWFRRAWVIQELGLAKRQLWYVVCTSLALSKTGSSSWKTHISCQRSRLLSRR
ncbi:HET-domain-containing protein [Acephala macrosclerotiorum]|nr:HET-domain-containing protein [Acephala macrosclerotiorum]